MDDVYLEGSTPEGTAMVGHLSVIVDTEGITFLGPEPGERRTVGWDRTSPLEFGPPGALPGGQAVTSLEFVVDGRPLRLLVPSKRDPGDGEGPAAGAGAESAVHDTVVDPVDAPLAPVTAAPASVLAEPLVAEPVLAEPPAAPAAPAVAEIPAAVPEPLFAEPILAALPAAPVASSVVEVPAPVGAAVDTSGSWPEGWRTDPDDEEVDEEATDEADLPTEPRVWFRPYSGHSRESRRPALSPSQRMLRLILVTVLVGLVPMAAGVWYFHLQPLPTRPAGHSLSDAAIAA